MVHYTDGWILLCPQKRGFRNITGNCHIDLHCRNVLSDFPCSDEPDLKYEQHRQSRCGRALSKEECVSLLQFCSESKALLDGMTLHDFIVKSMLEGSTFIQNLLIEMYCQCGSLEHAYSLFQLIPFPDQYAWNFLTKGYAQYGKMHAVSRLYRQMQCEGMLPDNFIYATLLSACFRPSSLIDGKQIHACVVCSLPCLNAVLGTSLINMYAKCGDIENAERVFCSMSDRDLISWNSMIVLYDRYGMSRKALDIFAEMIQDELWPDEYTLSNVISACTSLSISRTGRLVHCLIVQNQLESIVAVGNAIVNMYSKNGFIDDAKKSFDDISHQNIVSWTTIISGYFQNNLTMEALNLLNRMQWDGFFPDHITVISILSKLQDLNLGKCIHAQIIHSEVESDARLNNALLTMYINCNSLYDAKLKFDGMIDREVVAWTTMMEGFALHGQIKSTLKLLDQMRVEGVKQDKVMFVSILSSCADHAALSDGRRIHVCIDAYGFGSDLTVGNALINMYRKCGTIKDALIMFESMNTWNTISYISIVSACAQHVALHEGKWLHFFIVDNELELDDVVQNSFLTMYGRCGLMIDARAIFSLTHQRNSSLWNAMIGAYAQNGQGKEALQFFRQMQMEKMIPNESTFVSVLSACSHAGLLDEGYKYLASMYNDYGIVAEVDHYNCMVDLLGRVGRLDEAENMINTMPCEATSISWMTLLSACREQCDVTRGERAAERASALDTGNTAPYLMLSNIYHAAGRDDDLQKLVRKIKDIELRNT